MMNEVASSLDINEYEKYGADKLLASYGLFVRPEYRRRGIAEKLLRTREEICKIHNVKLTSTVFTTDASNNLADKLGYKLDASKRLSWEKLLFHSRYSFGFYSSYADIYKMFPYAHLKGVNDSGLTRKSLVYDFQIDCSGSHMNN